MDYTIYDAVKAGKKLRVIVFDGVDLSKINGINRVVENKREFTKMSTLTHSLYIKDKNKPCFSILRESYKRLTIDKYIKRVISKNSKEDEDEKETTSVNILTGLEYDIEGVPMNQLGDMEQLRKEVKVLNIGTLEEYILSKTMNYYLSKLGLKRLNVSKLVKLGERPIRKLATIGDIMLESHIGSKVGFDKRRISYFGQNILMKHVLVSMGFIELVEYDEHLVGTLFEALYSSASLQDREDIEELLVEKLVGRKENLFERIRGFNIFED